MKLADLKNMKRKPSLPLGISEVIFNHIEYIENEKDEVSAYRIYFDGFEPIYNKFFTDTENYALNAFLAQIDEYDYTPSAINAHKGAKVIVEMKLNDKGYTNANFRVRKAQMFK